MTSKTRAVAFGAMLAAGGLASATAFADDAATAPTAKPAAVTPAPAPASKAEAAKPAQPAQPAAATVAAKTEAAKPQHAAMSRKQVEEIQTSLDKNGANIPVDGLFGKKTMEALRTFQKSHGLKPTGYPDEETMKVLTKSA